MGKLENYTIRLSGDQNNCQIVEFGEHWDVFCPRPSVGQTRLMPENMDPRTHALFYDWCIQIRQVLHAGESFNNKRYVFVPSDNGIYPMLPPMWHTLPISEKKAVNVGGGET
jgi:hypothetical protein